MILKSYEIRKINLNENKIILLYGNNDGFKKEAINQLIIHNNIYHYDQNEILEDENNFLDTILSKSLFEDKKVIIIKRANDKLLNTLEKIDLKKLEDLSIIINSDNLEKKSKLRSKFEKDKNYLCIPFYPDNDQTLIKLSSQFFNEKKILISPSNINLIVNKCSGDRGVLLNEMEKIENYCKYGKKITRYQIERLINLNENHSVSKLVDNCLAKNRRKIINILNENNFNNEDCIVIVRTFISKSKKILKLRENFENTNNIDLTISSAKPPIFWKDKEIIKQQIVKWKSDNIKKLIFRLSEIELVIKKNINNSVNLITDFMINLSSEN